MWPGAGKVKDRTLIAEFTGEDPEDLGSFPLNSPDCMVQNQSVNNIWKNLVGSLNMTRSINENHLGKLWAAS